MLTLLDFFPRQKRGLWVFSQTLSFFLRSRCNETDLKIFYIIVASQRRMAAETYVFQAEINQLMSLIVNAFYSDKNVFLRELISNASDANDKRRHVSLSDGQVIDDSALFIRLTPNKDQKTLTIEDAGIGMSKKELIECLGTIARSGTKAFMEAMMQNKDSSLIGQFGVGFYSAFLVSDRVEVITRRVGEDVAHVWSSDANGAFSIAPAERADVGTSVVLHLKDDQHELLEESKLREIVTKHSAYIIYPIEMEVERTKEVEVEAEAEAETDEDGKVADDEKKAPTKETVTYKEWSKLNGQKPIWLRKADEITPEEYQTFYKSFSNDWQDAIAYKHFAVEGQLEFCGVLYLPSQQPHDLFNTTYQRRNLRLHVRRVFVSDKCDDIVPDYLGFVRGVIDSNDLPMNVSRETFQQNRIFRVLKKNIVKKCIDLMVELSDDAEKYKKFYENFSKSIKLGIYEDDTNRSKLADLVRCISTASDGQCDVTLRAYVDRMKPDQKFMFYLTGESLEQVRESPFLAPLKAKGWETLLLVDGMDEYMLQRLREYDGKKLVNIAKESAELKEALCDAAIPEDPELCTYVHEALGKEKVQSVRVCQRALDVPAVLIPAEYGYSANMERIMRAQTLQNNNMLNYMKNNRILEIVPSHPLIQAIRARKADAATKNWVALLHECAILHSGYTLENTNAFVKRVVRMMNVALNVDAEAEAEAEAEGCKQADTEPGDAADAADAADAMEALD